MSKSQVVKYSVDYQYIEPDAGRPTDNGQVIGLTAISEGGTTLLLPNVGDYVDIDNSTDEVGRESIRGRVRSRLFTYNRLSVDGVDTIHCNVNIVLEHAEEAEWSALIKE